MNDTVQGAAGRVGDAARGAVNGSPRARRMVDRMTTAGGAVRGKVPDGVAAIGAKGVGAVQKVAEGGARAVSRVATAGLSPTRVVKAHVRAGHEVAALGDLRRLDLEQIDRIKPRSLDVAYAAVAAASGAAAGVAITGTQLSVPVSGGVTAAPAVHVVLGAFAADATAVMALASAVVGHHALHYGYDPARPEEKVFVLSVVNWGTAATVASKATAFADVSRLTQGLVRGARWTQLNDSAVTLVTRAFTEAFGGRLVQRGLGKVVPVVGVVAGVSLNWLTLEQIADAADLAYRRRFLLEKYPHLADDAPEPVLLGEEESGARDDEVIAVLDLVPNPEGDSDDQAQPAQV
ncbi:serine/arginine repetitive matrix protein 2 [Cellulomonas cellasea DSM 20118]|uniref:Serine/arginine repetitive matrix protein 2 n=1 Tax=Cellulomonas cellasea DSM 20118 TaxID=1408250 RepID=A0A0A0BD49_9CELL|nr:serine/arginine repetitive matrix protein 2 [Cellulomonas cellasea DSM 20118]